MAEKLKDDFMYSKQQDKSFSSEKKEKLKYKNFKFLGQKRIYKLILKYGDFVRDKMREIEKEQVLEIFLKTELGTYFHKIDGVWGQYREGKIGINSLIVASINILGEKYVDIFLRQSLDVLKERKRHVYLAFITMFGAFFAFLVLYFSILMPIDTSSKPEGNFIFPGDERIEWLFTIVMALVVTFAGTSLVSLIFPRITLRIYTKSVKKNQLLGFLPTQHLLGPALYRKLLSRALVFGFLIFNLSYTLSSQLLYISFMRSVNPSGITLIPDPELMIQSMWMVAIPSVLIIVPIWVMMDIGLARTRKVRGVDTEFYNLTGSKTYKFIKGYAGIGFFYNLSLILFVWSTDAVPVIRNVVRLISPLIVIVFMFPLVILIENNNEVFKRKLWNKLKNYDINRKFNVNISVETIDTREELLGIKKVKLSN